MAQNSDTQKNQKSSFFNCCACGDEEIKKEVTLDLTEKRPEVPVRSSLPVTSTITNSNYRPPSVAVSRPMSKPKVIFTYSSPDPKLFLLGSTATPSKVLGGQVTTVHTEYKLVNGKQESVARTSAGQLQQEENKVGGTTAEVKKGDSMNNIKG